MENAGKINAKEKLVLIVDDDKDIRELLEFIMLREGFRVAAAVDGQDGQAKARALSPDIILLDLMLPKAGGFETLHELQAEETARIPIILMTGRQLDPSTFEMIKQESNVRDCIEKPIKTEVLLARMHQLLKTCPGKRAWSQPAESAV